MWCDNCKNAEMVKSFFNTVQTAGYSTIFQYQCPECDYSFKKVA